MCMVGVPADQISLKLCIFLVQHCCHLRMRMAAEQVSRGAQCASEAASEHIDDCWCCTVESDNIQQSRARVCVPSLQPGIQSNTVKLTCWHGQQVALLKMSTSL
jgi:hypothetical protein